MPARKERPKLRQQIIDCGFKPYLVNGEWDNFSYLRPDDPKPHTGMSEGLKVQFRKMVEEGLWGDVTIKRYKLR